MGKPSVTIVIPTQRRPGPLARAARSVLAQTGVDPAGLELVVADNDTVPSARALATSLGETAPFPVRYVHEPNPGVANVRNAALAGSDGDFIAFLDDDEEAPPGWLAALLDMQRRFDADVVFGPVRTRLPDAVTAHRAYFERFFARLGPAEACVIDYHYGCGDSLLRRSALPHRTRPFSATRNHSGGEDDLLFTEMRAAGARCAWAPDAWVWEDPAPDRINLNYTTRRAFAYGQGAPAHCASCTPPNRLGVAGWMVAGVFQALIFGSLYALMWLARAPNRAFALDKAARGVGKTFWWSPFKIRFYGLSPGAQTAG